jgi:glycosyltransferase involved in cell wall biosynthesis
MAKAMIQLSADPELRDRLGKAGQERVQQFYRWENRVEPLMALYQEAIAESQPQGKTGNVMKVP